jgi:heme-degrading monooxygenase HmoA
MRSMAEKLVDQLSPALKTAKGFKTVTFLVDDAAGEYGSVTLWESKEDIENFRKAAGPQIEKTVSRIAKGPPSIRLFEVYEPKV